MINIEKNDPISNISGLMTIISFLIPDIKWWFRIIIALMFLYIFLLRNLHNKKKLFIIFVPFLIIVVSTITISIIKYQTVKISNDLIVSRKHTEQLTFKESTINFKMINEINKLENLKELQFDNCYFEDGVLSHLILPLKKLYMTNCSGVINYKFLQNMSYLETLVIENCGVVDDYFPQLNQDTLHKISIAKNSKFSNLELLHLANLYYIDFSNTSVDNLSPLARCQNLNEVYGDNTFVSDLSPLALLTKLNTIHFNNCNIHSVTTEFVSSNIEFLYLSDNNLTDCSGFMYSNKLINVNLDNNNLNNVLWLSKSKETLKNIMISNNPLTEDQIDFLIECSNTETLHIDNIPINSLDIISNMKELKCLQIMNCGIEDIAALNKCPFLYYLNLAMNDHIEYSDVEKLNVRDIALSYIPHFENYNFDFDNIYILDCPINQQSIIKHAFKDINIVFTNQSDIPYIEIKHPKIEF